MKKNSAKKKEDLGVLVLYLIESLTVRKARELYKGLEWKYTLMFRKENDRNFPTDDETC